MSGTASMAQAQSSAKPQLLAANSAAATAANFDRIDALSPKPQTSNTRLDYTVLTEALDGTVIRLGPSHRRHMSRPAAKVGSRMVTGHTTPYRLEGSRVSFSFLSEEYLEQLTAYREDLERIGTQIDLTHIPKNEQLAFWLNLHNVALIEQISLQYPNKYPNKLEKDGVPLDQAKILNIKNVPLSLQDIREKIVYPNWSQPEVIYGFFRGNIGSPALQNYAYTGENVQDLLIYQAGEFVNALRGFNATSKNRNISRLYDEAKSYYFTDWDTDLPKHLLKYARDEVAEDIRSDKPWRVDRYDEVVADLVGGSLPRISGFHSQNAGSEVPYEVMQLVRELGAKTKVLRNRKLIGTGTVTIQDLDTEDLEPTP